MAVLKPTLTAPELETAIENIGEAMIILNTRGQVIRANKVALGLLNYTEAELIGQLFHKKVKTLNAEYRPINPARQPMVKSIVSAAPAYDYVYFLGNNISPVPVFISSSPIVKKGRLIGLIGIFRDISLWEAVDQMKSEFISLASHQLRTPLSSIKTYTHMILDGYMGQPNEEIKSALKVIVDSTNRMNELISTLLSITRMESGAIVLRRDSVDIARITKEVVEEMRVAASRNSIELKLEIKGGQSTKIRSDGPIIKEIIANLVSNAVKYSKNNGRVLVAVKTEPDHLSVIVSDFGLGIPAGSKAQIFSKFFRAPNAIRQETNGTGLGLYLVKGLVDQLGGRISFTSEEGKKTTFRIRLPRKLAAKQ